MPAFANARRALVALAPGQPQIVASRGDLPHGQLGGLAGGLGYNTRFQGQTKHHVGYRDVKWMKVIFPGFGGGGGGETILTYDYPIRVGIYFPSAPGAQVAQLSFEGGRRDPVSGVLQGAIPVGAAQYATDTILPQWFGWSVFPANAVFYVRTMSDVLIGQANWGSVGRDTTNDGGEYNYYGRSDTMNDATLTGAVSGVTGQGLGSSFSAQWNTVKPSAIIGEPIGSLISVITTGDSVMQGPGGGPAGILPNYTAGGYIPNGLYDVNGHHIPWSNFGNWGSSASGLANNSEFRLFIPTCTDHDG